jgi:hypothetical protein
VAARGPFVSCAVHVAEAGVGFDIILSNPPWVRSHRWPAAVASLVRRRYRVAKRPGWRFGARLAGAPVAAAAQVDLSMVFLERALELLAPGGVLGILLPAKCLRSLYAGPARRLLLEEAQVLKIADHGLDQHAIFAADAFATSIVARRPVLGRSDADPAEGESDVAVTLTRKRGTPLDFRVARRDLPLFVDDPDAPWLLVPEGARSAFRRMQKVGPPIGLHEDLRVRRGVFTGANAVMLVRDAAPRLGGLAWIRAQGWHGGRDTGQGDPPAADFETYVESRHVRPIVRGADIDAWCFRSPRSVIWTHGDDGRATASCGPRLRRYLERHAEALARRTGARAMAPGAIYRVSADTLANKVAWHDLAPTLRAVALPGRVRSGLGETGPLVPLNTVYFIPFTSPDRAHVLAAILNSTPVRTFARAIAERAKDARFRFFAWTIGALPLPGSWDVGPAAARLLDLSRRAHLAG